MQPLFEHRLELAGYETRALELEGAGPPVVLFHGFADSADTWRVVLDRLGRSERAALALDLPGFGHASRLDTREPILPQLDRFAAAAVEHVSAASGGAIVSGNSLGGCVAMRAAQREDLDVAGIVPVAPAGLDMPRWFFIVERDPVVRTLLASPVPLPGPVVRAAVAEAYRRLAFAHPREADGDIVRSFTSHFRDRATVRRIVETARRVLTELRDPFELERIRCPVLLVWGQKDLLVYPSGAERVLAETGGPARLELIEDCGHCPQVEEPDLFSSLLLDFPHSLARAA